MLASTSTMGAAVGGPASTSDQAISPAAGVGAREMRWHTPKRIGISNGEEEFQTLFCPGLVDTVTGGQTPRRRGGPDNARQARLCAAGVLRLFAVRHPRPWLSPARL